MKSDRPGTLAVRAVNQYRRRDVLPYLGLRYYLDNSAARSDKWARNVAPQLVLTRDAQPYFRSMHYKDVDSDGVPSHRAMYLPGPNEALAEAALLAECATHSQVFTNPKSVFSYQLNASSDRTGTYRYYVPGLRARQSAIARACENYPDGQVTYVDIKRFYPSISTDRALVAWKTYSEIAGMSSYWIGLGEKLLDDHSKAQHDSSNAILTGPMVSHMIGNLVLREVDRLMEDANGIKYVRYVDDITLVGSAPSTMDALKLLQNNLESMGLQLHQTDSEKSWSVSSEKWLTARDDFSDSRKPVSWMTFIADLKRVLLRDPAKKSEFIRAFHDEGMRIPVLDYSNAVWEASYLQRVSELMELNWFRKKIDQPTVKSVVGQAITLRESFTQELFDLLENIDELDHFQRKRRVPKLRYRASRLSYLASESELDRISELMSGTPELFYHERVMVGIAARDLTEVAELGTNAAQGAAQPLRASGGKVRFDHSHVGEVGQQSLAIARLNGIEVYEENKEGRARTELMEVADKGATPAIMKFGTPFVRELACLHGVGCTARHTEVLESAFDLSDQMAMDAVDQLQQSVSA